MHSIKYKHCAACTQI